jgi:Xaa-Pro dipeptidase
MKFVFAEGIRAANPHLRIVSATPVTAGCRMIKDAHEIECLRLASHATLLVYRAVAQSLTLGMTTANVHELIGAAYQRVGFEGEASLNVDQFTALPHGSSKVQTLREGSILMLDDGCVVEGYNSDITRTFVLGKATDKMKSVFDLVKRAQTVALNAARRCRCGCGCRRAQSDCGRRLRAGVHVFHASGRSRTGNGRPRVALFREEQYVRLGFESALAGWQCAER